MIYTSYFGNLKELKSKNIVPVSIALWNPKWYNGHEYKTLAPKADMLKRDISNAQYIEEYKTRVLKCLNPLEVYKSLESIFGENIALICYERPGEFCHRKLVSEWFKNAGLEVEEYFETFKIEETKSKEPEYRQIELF
jgi:hypothetical protein